MKQLIEKAAIEERAAWSRYLLDQQSIYYAQYLADLDDARKIRQDIRGQLQTAYQLMDQQDETNARTILDGISGQLNHHPVYCPNRIVNSILGVKGSLYRQKNIAFSFDCRLPEPLSLSGVTLCSLFTNVLDNAYHAVQSGGPELRRIDLSAYLVNGFLLLTCQNPIPPGSQPKLERRRKAEDGTQHGLGLLILQTIAEQHKGTMEIQTANDIFQIRLLLQLPAPSTSPVPASILPQQEEETPV